MKAILLAATILLSLAGQNPPQDNRSSKKNQALSNVGADLCVAPDSACDVAPGQIYRSAPTI
jgi:adenine-specific DNA glycosylase